MWRQTFRMISQRAQLGGESLFQRRVVAFTSTSLLLGSCYVVYSTYQQSLENKQNLILQKKKEELEQKALVKKSVHEIKVTEEQKAKIIIEQTLQKEKEQEEKEKEKLKNEEIEKQNLQAQLVLVQQQLQAQQQLLKEEQEKKDKDEQEKWRHLIQVTQQIEYLKQKDQKEEQARIQREQLEKDLKERELVSEATKQEVKKEEPVQKAEAQGMSQKEQEEYIKLYEQNLIQLQNKCSELQDKYSGSINSLQNLKSEIGSLQDRIQEKNQRIYTLRNNIYFSQVAFNLLMKLQHDVGDISTVLKQTKQIKDELVQKAFDQYINENYPYLCEKGVPSRSQIYQLFQEEQKSARLAILLSKTNKSWWGFLKAKLNINTAQDVDSQGSLSILKRVEVLVKQNKLRSALQEIQQLSGLPRQEMDAFYRALQARVGLEAFTNILSSQFKLILQVFT